MCENIKIPIGKSKFRQMVKSGFYSDKTKFISELFQDEGDFYLYLRPRRFGKTLLLDTIIEIAKCNKELFENCAIYKDLTHEWVKYPVIHINFSKLFCHSIKDLNKLINKELEQTAIYYKVQNNINTDTNVCFAEYLNSLFSLLTKLENYQTTPIILIDEYDYLLINCNETEKEGFLNEMKGFFSCLKALHGDSKFVFVTGVAKFNLCGISSGCNSMQNISLKKNFDVMSGYTQDDIEKLFLSSETLVDSVLKNLKMSKIEFEQELKSYYNGYSFTPNNHQTLYNPTSILKFFEEKSFNNFWYKTGHTTIFFQKMKKNIDKFNINWDTESFLINKETFNETYSSLEQYPIFSLMFQTGYLTFNLNPENDESDFFYLKFPNKEIKTSFKNELNKIMFCLQEESGKKNSSSILDNLRKQNYCDFFDQIRSCCLAKASYRFLDKTEKSFHANLYSFFNGAFHANCDVESSSEKDIGPGRADIFLVDNHNDKKLMYIFELKVDKSSIVALDQIKSKSYDIYNDFYFKKILIGLSYDSKKLNITDAAVEIHKVSEKTKYEKDFFCRYKLNQLGYFETTSE